MKKSKNPVMGKILIILGLIIKIAQIICVAAGVREMGNTAWTAITAGFLAGGLLVFGMERKKKTAVFADIAAVAVLMSLIKTEKTLLLYIPLFTLFVSFAIMLFTVKKKSRIYGAVTLALAAVLFLCAMKVISLSALPGTLILVAIYAVMAVGAAV